MQIRKLYTLLTAKKGNQKLFKKRFKQQQDKLSNNQQNKQLNNQQQQSEQSLMEQNPLKQQDKQQDNQQQQPGQSSTEQNPLKNKKIDPSLENTIEALKFLYTMPSNSDVKIRNILIGGLNKNASILYISSISDSKIIENQVIEALLTNNDDSKLIEDIVYAQSVKTVEKFEDVLSEVNSGNAALLVDSYQKAYIIGSSNFQGRAIEKTENEVSLKGPKESFNEKGSTNISLIRKKIKNENLIVEVTPVSKRLKNEVYIVYMKDLADDQLLNSIKEKLSSLNVDSIQNLSLLEQYLEEHSKSIFPTILYTERPDRAASFIEDGFIVLLMENSPSSLVLPATFWSFFHTTEDYYLKFIYGNFIRSLRLFALFITVFISATYISITNYHVEMIPTDLLLAISATTEVVPFPAIVEILLMEIAFELIREAGLRVPSPIGPTIGIVGALILGQAAVQANIVSPLVVIVVALGGLSSFAVGDISMNFAIRLTRFIFIFSAAFFGFYGMTAVFTVLILYLVSVKSFGVPYLAPMAPTFVSSKDTVYRKMIPNQLFRPGYIKPKDMKKKQAMKNEQS